MEIVCLGHNFGFFDDQLNHAKASLGVARVLSQLLFMLNADKEFDHEALLCAAIACIDDDALAKMLSPMVQEKYILDQYIGGREEYLLYLQNLKDEAQAKASQILKLERERYDRLADMEPKPDPEIFERLYVESWYYTKEDEALLHLKLHHFLSKCDIIKEDSTRDGVLERLDLPGEFASIPLTLVKTAIQRRIYLLKMFASIDPYKKLLRQAISKLVGEGGQFLNKFKFFFIFLGHGGFQYCPAPKDSNEDPSLEAESLVEKFLGCSNHMLSGLLDHCRTILSMSSSAGEIDQALDKFVEELKRGVERRWIDDQPMRPAYYYARRKLQLEEELPRCSRVHISLDEEMDKDKEVKVAEVLPINSSCSLSLEDFNWVSTTVLDTLHEDTKLSRKSYPTYISGPIELSCRHSNCYNDWTPVCSKINFCWRRVYELHKELLMKTSASCLFFFDILRGMRLPQLMHVFQNIFQGKDVKMKFEHVDKDIKLEKMGLADIVENNLEKFKAHDPGCLQIHELKIGDSWQAIDLNPNRNLGDELIDFAKLFSGVIKHMKGRKNEDSQFNDQSRLDFVKKTLEGYKDSHIREHRLRGDITRTTKEKEAASRMLGDLFYVQTMHDAIEGTDKVLALGDPNWDTVDWWNYRISS